MKQLPVNSLSLVALCHVYKTLAHAGDDHTVDVEVEYEVYNQAAFDRVVMPKGVRKCDCCGHQVKYVCVVQHTPTGDLYYVGRDCANKIECLKCWAGAISQSSVALAERAACSQREVEFLTKHTDMKEAVLWAKQGLNKIGTEMVEKIRRFGSISDGQLAFFKRLHSEDVARRATATGTCPTGKLTVTGTVLSVKVNVGEKPRWGFPTVTAKVLLDLGNGVKVYGNAPGSQAEYVPFAEPRVSVVKGQQVCFTADFSPSLKDPLFGFWKRPRKWTVTAPATPIPA